MADNKCIQNRKTKILEKLSGNESKVQPQHPIFLQFFLPRLVKLSFDPRKLPDFSCDLKCDQIVGHFIFLVLQVTIS